MSGSFDEKGRLDIADGRIVFCTGKKKSGKSVLAKLLFASYPDDRIVIDVARDDGPSGGSIIDVTGSLEELPTDWPEHRREEEGQRMTLRFAPDAGSKILEDEIDALLDLAVAHGEERRAAGGTGCCVLIHEIGMVAKLGKKRPGLERILNANRHHAVTMIACGPRPMDIKPLVLQQSDLVYVFELPNKADQRRIAEQIGWDEEEFRAACLALGPHEYLRYDANEPKPVPGEDDQRLQYFEALPEPVVRAVLAAKG